MKYEWKPIDFRSEIIEYKESLPTESTMRAFNEVLSGLADNKRDIIWIYYALSNLADRDISKYKSLFFYKPFIEEVDTMREAYLTGRELTAKKIIEKDKSEFMYQKILIPALMDSDRPYQVSAIAQKKLREIYGTDKVPKEYLNTEE